MISSLSPSFSQFMFLETRIVAVLDEPPFYLDDVQHKGVYFIFIHLIKKFVKVLNKFRSLSFVLKCIDESLIETLITWDYKVTFLLED